MSQHPGTLISGENKLRKFSKNHPPILFKESCTTKKDTDIFQRGVVDGYKLFINLGGLGMAMGDIVPQETSRSRPNIERSHGSWNQTLAGANAKIRHRWGRWGEENLPCTMPSLRVQAR